MRTVVIVGILATASAVAAGQSWPELLGKARDTNGPVLQRQLASTLFEAPEITHTLGLLRSDGIKSWAWEEQEVIGVLQRKLDRFVTEVGGELLLEEAVRRLESGSDAERERAALILVRYPKLPGPVVDRFRRSPRLDLRCFGAWFASEGPTEQFASDSRLFRRQKISSDGPFIDVLPAVRERMILPPEALAATKEEYQKSYREVFLTALNSYWTHIRLDQVYEVDFDGDGESELVAAARVPDGWDVGRSATLVLKRIEGRWRLVGFRAWHQFERGLHSEPGALDLVIADFDGDERPEVIELTTLVGGWVWEQSFYWDEHTLNAPPPLRGRGVTVTPDPGTGRPLLVVRSAFNPTQGGKALYLTTALATRLDLVSYTEIGIAEVATVLVRGNGW